MRRVRVIVQVTLLVAACLIVLSPAATRSGPDARLAGRDVIAQMSGWNWRSIGRECRETLGPLGYSAVQTEPPQEHSVLPDQGFPWWESYSAVSYRLDSRWGTRAELAELVRSCHSAGVQVYVNVVINNMSALAGCGVGSAGSPYCHYSYPAVPYGDNDFHHCGTPADDIQDYHNRYQVFNCQTFGAADLATETDRVRDRIGGYLNDLLSLGVDGFRIDSAKYLPPADISAIERRLTRPAFVYQEVLYDYQGPVQPQEYLATGDVMDARYAGSLSAVFRQGRLATLHDFTSPLPSDKSVVFVANHDTVHNGSTLSYADPRRYTLAHAFMLAWPYGRPKVLSDYAFTGYDEPPPSDALGRTEDSICGSGPWQCEHSWPGIAGMVGFHAAVHDLPVADWFDDGDNLIAFGRGRTGYLIINGARTAVTDHAFHTSLPPGNYCNVLNGPPRDGICAGPTYQVDNAGWLHAALDPLSGIALHLGATTR
ncbi:alpha-amylase family protein [Nocardia sp. NPDC088792]|uniref:alpha-amylase n=1 Tax=Nocardia sp. NPDC088792 TaxID=3364332 RepID=UPI0038230AE1